MNLLVIVLVVLCVTTSSQPAPTPCELLGVKDKICDETEYEAYRNCVEETKLTREKRQTHPCQQPRVVEPVVQTVKPFEILVPVEPLKNVRQPALKTLGRTIVVQPGTNQLEDDAEDEENTSYHYRLPVNVTTVIRLTNIVNNTNNIHMPTTLNNTNVNNIHIYSNLTEVGDGAASEPEEKCCTAVRPQSCHTSTQGVRCKHRKFQTCGPQCTAKVVHIQKRKRCNRSTGDCQEKIAYVPQPEKPTCVYIEEWPFVVCGKVANMSVVCAGCYDHYGYGYEAVHGHSKMQPQCHGCYDDAFDVGPKYRRGPVLRPFYYHQAPCYLTGSCPGSYDDCGYGCYGHERIDPAWGQPDTGPYDPAMGPGNTIYYDEGDLQLSNEASYDWGVPTAKCAVATDGNTITVKNCTDTIDNPYMAAPASHLYHHKLKTIDKKHPGHRPQTTTGAPTTTNAGSPVTTNTTTTKGPEATVEDDPASTEASTTPLAVANDDEEEYEVAASGAGLRNNEIYFVEEYIDDEDFSF